MQRKGYEQAFEDNAIQQFIQKHHDRITFHYAAWLENISSTWLRTQKPWLHHKQHEDNQGEIDNLIHPKVAEYILQHHLYE